MDNHIAQAIRGIVLLLLLVVATVTTAQPERDPQNAVWKTERNFNLIQEAWELADNDQTAEAEAEFRGLVNRFSDAYEKAQARFGLAQILLDQGKFDEGLGIIEQLIQQDVLDNPSHFNAMLQLAQLYYSRDRYNDALTWLDRWEAESGVAKPVIAYEMRASIYASQERFRLSLENIDQAIALHDEEPKEQWLNLKLTGHYELEQYAPAKVVLKQLIARKPDVKRYWTYLTQINLQLNQPREALAALAVAYRSGMLDKQTEWLQLYSLYGSQDMPFQAAKVLKEGLDKGVVESTKAHWEQLGNAWYGARELDNAIAALGEAAKLATDGKLDMQLAYILVDKEDWAGAKSSLRGAINKGGISETERGNMYVLLGMSEMNTGSEDAARDAFSEALKFERTRGAAQQWLNHLNERRRNVLQRRS